MDADAVKYIAEKFEGINLTQLTACNQTVDDSGPFSTSFTSGKEPIFSTNGDDPQDMFGKIAVNVKVTI